MSRMVRWVIAAAAITALVYTLVPSLPAPSDTGRRRGDGRRGDICPADAKKANLDFTVNDMNGKSVALSSFKGKVIVLDFWATWCPPCKAEIPGFVELQQAYGSKGLQVVGVSVDDPADKLPAVCHRVQDELPGARGPGPRRPAGCLRADVGDSDDVRDQPGRQDLPQTLGSGGQGPLRERYQGPPVVTWTHIPC